MKYLLIMISLFSGDRNAILSYKLSRYQEHFLNNFIRALFVEYEKILFLYIIIMTASKTLI